MKSLITRMLNVSLFTVCSLFVATAAAAPGETICSDHPELLARRQGVYVSNKLIATVRKTRRWDLGRPDEGHVSELRISPSGEVTLSFAWHEAANLGREFAHGCLVFKGNQVRLQHREYGPSVFERLGSASTQAGENALYFKQLFKGCFVDQGGKRWCFGSTTVEIAGVVRQATLKLDQSELPARGSILQVTGEPDFWLFMPRGQGWSVYQTTWASSEKYVEPTWAQPWTVLLPAK